MAISDEIKNIKELEYKAYASGLYFKASKIALAGIELAIKINDDESLIYFYYRSGHCLSEMGKTDEALFYLLKASQYNPNANPIDIYNAITNIIEISISKKPFKYSQNLLDDARKMIDRDMNKIEWRHKIDFLNGYLEYIRGNYLKSYEFYKTAYHFSHQCIDCPSYTNAVFIHELTSASYFLRDIASMRKWINDVRISVEDDKTSMLIIKMRYEKLKKCTTSYKLNTMAISLIDKTELIEKDSTYDYKEAIKVFFLTNYWEAIEIYMKKITFNKDNFFDLCFLGDKHLAKSRYILKLPSVNDEIEDDDFNMYVFKSKGHSEIAKAELQKAEYYYEKMKIIAKKEDERLETKHYSRTTQNRLDKVQKILNLLKG